MLVVLVIVVKIYYEALLTMDRLANGWFVGSLFVQFYVFLFKSLAPIPPWCVVVAEVA